MMYIETGNANPILRNRCQEVAIFDNHLKRLVQEMTDTMLAPTEDGVTGVGLAANQVGIDKRILLITLNMENKKRQKILPMINPQLLEVSPQKVVLEEGCLSIPGIYEKLSRPAKIRARWQNIEGHWCERRFDSWDARIFLHEYDHLEGILFTDYLDKSLDINLSQKISEKSIPMI